MTQRNSTDKLVKFSDTGDLDVLGNLNVTGTVSASDSALSATELGFIDGVTAGTATASKAVVLGASKEIATITTATITNVNTTTATVAGGLQQSFAAITAGTTQTQAGATAITTDIVQVTTGTASDGIILPALTAGQIGRTIRVINASANAGVIYAPGATSTNTINGTAGATGVPYAASKMLTLVAVSATAWVSTLSN